MITVHMIGGLGNQLFQYAAARGLAHRLGTQVRLNLQGCGGESPSIDAKHHPRPFELTKFAIAPMVIAGKTAEHRMRGLRSIAKNLPAKWRVALTKVYIEPDLTFREAVFGLPNGAYLYGFFQCERYFAHIADIIRNEFQLKDRAAAAHVKETLSGLRRPERKLVSLHVRRGDYLFYETKGSPYFGIKGSLLVPLERLRWTMSQFPGADFVVFSDDLAWCREHIRGDDVRYSPFHDVAQDLVAMTLCDDNIIANSSFSWWGAWLNPKPGKIVYAPANWWVPGAGGDGDMPDIVPRGWLKY